MNKSAERERLIDRFEDIKNHKPRAPKKLNEIADILTAMYYIDSDKASEMWQYIIDLNITDNIEFARYYVAQVFNKLIQRMTQKDSAYLISMIPKRIDLLITYGYDGASLYSIINSLVIGLIELDKIKLCKSVLDNVITKNGSLAESTVSKNIIKSLIRGFSEQAHNPTLETHIKEFGDVLQMYNDREICAYYSVRLNQSDVEESLNLCISFGFEYEFINIAKRIDQKNKNYLRQKWEEYVRKNGTCSLLILNHSNGDFNSSDLNKFVDVALESPVLLNLYFENYSPHYKEFYISIIKELIIDEQWDDYINYMSKALNSFQSPESFETGYWTLISRFYEGFMNSLINKNRNSNCLKGVYKGVIEFKVSSYNPYTDNFGREYNEVSIENINEFINALERINDLSNFSICHNQFEKHLKFIKEKIERVLEDIPLADNKNLVKKNIKYFIKDYFLSEKEQYAYFELGELEKECINVLGLQEFVEYIIQDKQILEFYVFYRGSIDYISRIITYCLNYFKFNLVSELFSKMIEKLPSDRRLWEYRMFKTLLEVIDYYSSKKNFSKSKSNNLSEKIIDYIFSITLTVDEYLSELHSKTLDGKLLLLKQDSHELENYIDYLYNSLLIYSSEKKPQGKGNKDYLRHLAEYIIESFDVVVKMGRLDVLSEELTILSKANKTLKPMNYSALFYHAITLLDNKMDLYYMNNEIFKVYFQDAETRDDLLIELVDNICWTSGEQAAKKVKNIIVNIRGNIF